MGRFRGRFSRVLFALIILVGASLSVAGRAAEINDNVGTRAFPSLKIGVGAATVGMGEAGVALSDDAYATYWNVAGLARVRRTQIALMNNAWLLDLRQNYVAVAQPLGESSGLGAFLSYLDYGEIVGRDDTGAETGLFRPYDLAGGIGLGFSVNETIALGLQAKYLRQQIDDATADGFALDLGVRYDQKDSGFSVGASLQHLGTSMQFDTESFALPTTVRAGIGYRILDDRAEVALDSIFPFDNDPRFGAGISYEFAGALTVRGGYRFQLGGNELGTVSGLTAGFGLRLESFFVDYAFVSYGDLGPTNRVSLAAAF